MSTAPAAPPPAPSSFTTRCAPCRRRSRWWSWSTGSPPPAPISPRSRADHIVAQDTSLVGSIGVLFQYPNFTEVLKTIGIKVEEIKSSPLKAAPNGFEPTSPEARAAIEAIVLDSYAWFKGLVKDRRKMDDAQLAAVADGRVFTGRQGVGLKLVDEPRQRKDRAGLAGEGKEGPGRHAGARLFAGAAVQRAVLPARRRLDLPGGGPFAPWRSASRSGVRCRRSSDSTLTVSWRFGTLHAPTDPGSSKAAVNDQVRACATYRRAESASLSARRREHRQRHPRRDHQRHGAAATASSCAASAPFRSSTGRPAPAAIRAPAPMSRSSRSRCRSSRPARKCASG